MKSVSVTELKANLARYLRLVRRGSDVQVLDRGVPIARIVPLHEVANEADGARLDRLVKAGILRKGASDLSWAAAEPPVRAKGAELSSALDEEREDRS